MDLRPATLDDLQALSAWIPDAAACNAWGGAKVHFPFTTETLREDIQFDSFDTYSFVDDDGELVGLGQVVDIDDTRLHLARVIIRPERQGRGLGIQLCRQLIAQGVKKYGERNITLKVNSDNDRAISLYSKMGFRRETGELDDKTQTDAFYMILNSEGLRALRGAPGS